ncbi:hypothetical protein [Clostridium sp. HBUAS56010]|uniref:hypothetical protein n=1 Tax=Clostridium sp. HBUAS56010 TaxID=2571127 RepID=UPI001177518B|nr:hypothetical protein [Clostridium sp. HBUAS56010]
MFFSKKIFIYIVTLAFIISSIANIYLYLNNNAKKAPPMIPYEPDCEALKPEDEGKTAINNSLINSSYKMFYGEWEITDNLNYKSRLFPSPQGDLEEVVAPDIIGNRIYFNQNEILFNNTIVGTSPSYWIYIIPVIENGQQQHFLGDHSISVMELGISGDYFNYVEVNCLETTNKLFPINSTSFYIIDNNTLIFEYDGFEFLMKRVAFIKNADMYEKEHN